MSKLNQLVFSLLLLIFYLLIQVGRSWPDQNLHLYFCDVEQGDAILITQGQTQLLIDGGRSDELVMSCLAQHVPFWDRQLELVVATHADSDHIGGLSEVLKSYHVTTLLISPYAKDTQVFEQLKTAINTEISEGAVLKKPILGLRLVFPQVGINDYAKNQSVEPTLTVEVVSPLVATLSDDVRKGPNPESTLSDVEAYFGENLSENQSHNDLSIGLFLTYGQTKVLLMGDIEAQTELALVEAGVLSDIDILKVGHHGAKTSTSPEFIQQVQPEISVVSVASSNDYGHPSPEVMNRLIQLDSQILRTDQLGTIHIETDGQTYWWSQPTWKNLIKFLTEPGLDLVMTNLGSV